MKKGVRLSKNHWIGLFALLVYLVTVLNSTGYYHPDEHYQIIEFAGLKAGWNTDTDLTWEYNAQIRPTLQPVLALLCFQVLDLLYIQSPYIKEAILRLFTAIFALLIIWYFSRSVQHTVKSNYQTIFFCLSFFLWFIPAVNVRFSSETWSGLCLLLAIAWIYNNAMSVFSCLCIGFLLGLGFEFRFQLALCIIGLFFWLKLIGKWENWKLYYILSGCSTAVLLGILIDSWFYGEFVCAPYNYFVANILNGVASMYGVSPWYFYLDQVMVSTGFLFGTTIWISLLFLLFHDSRNILLWCLVPFLTIHCFIPHKELRFLFPVINFVPLLLIWFYQLIMDKLKSPFIRKTVIIPVISMVFLINLVGLIMMMFKPAGNGNVEMAKYIWMQYGKNISTIYVYKGNSPYTVGTAKGLSARFYLTGQIELKDFLTIEANNQQRQPEVIKDHDLIVLPAGFSKGRYLVEGWGFKEEKRSISDWVNIVNRFYRVYDESETLVLYTKKNEKEN
ncbi:mannosyltransferase [Parabacteroides faecis]|uniref:mannosyltransferase n=1 Tax=Parabacteroides faecis TaxID=1217282 RepID=UPI003522979F